MLSIRQNTQTTATVDDTVDRSSRVLVQHTVSTTVQSLRDTARHRSCPGLHQHAHAQLTALQKHSARYCGFCQRLSSSSGTGAMSHDLFPHLDQPSGYRERDTDRSALADSCTLYVGNLSFYTTEEQVMTLFSQCGPVRKIVMGLDRHTRTPCGFCFVEYFTPRDARDCMLYISGTKLDDRVIRCDVDVGFKEGRQWGRGKSGGQVRDEFRVDFDTGRGGWGKLAQKERAVREPDVRPPEQAQAQPDKDGEQSFDRFRED